MLAGKAMAESACDKIVTAKDCDVIVGRHPDHPGKEKISR
jgi:hypothetical protein